MKKIIFIINQLRVGGVPKALIELLRNIEGKYDVSLLSFNHDGSFFGDIPEYVKILAPNKYLEMTEASVSDLKGKKFLGMLRLLCSMWSKLLGKKVPSYLVSKMVGKYDAEYDVAFSYGHPMPENMFCNLTSEITLHCIKAKKKVIVIHCDFESYGGNTKHNRKIVKQFDNIAVVSKSVGEAMIRCIPDIKEKIVILRNCHDYDKIIKMSNENPVEYSNRYSFLSIARLSEEKGLERCISIFQEVHNMGYDVGWHIIGAGQMLQKIKQTIIACNASDYIFLEGEQINPYRFLKNASFLLVPSFHEAAPMVFDEAACLGVPIISTDTLSAREMVEDRNLGIVCNNNPGSIKKAILHAIESIGDGEYNNAYMPSNLEAVSSFISICEE